MSILKLKRLTVSQAEKVESSALHVMNKATPRGNINFTITAANNQRTGMQVPITWIPIDLSNFAQKNDVLRDPNFRRLVAKGFLHIVDNDDAEKALLSDKAIKETNRIYDISEDLETLESNIEVPVDDQINAQAPAGVENPFIQNIILRSTSESAEDLISELDGRLDTFTEADVIALMDGVSSQDLKQWATEARAAITV